MLGSGRLKERIEIERPVRIQNDSGGFDNTLVSILTTYSDVTQLKPSNDVIASQENIIQPFNFKIRWRQDVILKVADVVTWRNRIFEIIGFENDISRTYINITAKTANESTGNGQV